MPHSLPTGKGWGTDWIITNPSMAGHRGLVGHGRSFAYWRKVDLPELLEGVQSSTSQDA